MMKLFPVSTIIFTSLIYVLGSCQHVEPKSEDWCDHPIRPQLQSLHEIETNSDWFKVYDVGMGVYAITEPFNYQEVISYLIIGSDKAVLFDTGNGFASILKVVEELTILPIIVINSHAHYDHIGGNFEFQNILAFKNEYTLHWSKSGWSHDLIKNEVRSDALCLHKLPGIDTSQHHIKPFKISTFIEDGDIIDIGDRKLEIISVPGHTPDAMALLDRDNGYLWTGDTYYEAAIWLYFDGTDLAAFQKSIHKLSSYSPILTRVFPAHNTAIAEPDHLRLAASAFDDILNGSAVPKNFDRYALPVETDALEFEFKNFSFLIRRDFLTARGLDY